tara:strand:+ start:164 stop:481 length:318 start_codon:yes stop_codon:yes gene_type:complete
MDKKKFLYYNLNKLNNDKLNIIENYIKKNDIEYKENSNGYLLNISQLENKHIDFLYDLYNLKENKINHIDIDKFNITGNVKKNIKKEKYIKYECSNLEKLILSYS